MSVYSGIPAVPVRLYRMYTIEQIDVVEDFQWKLVIDKPKIPVLPRGDDGFRRQTMHIYRATQLVGR